ncbi:MAG TPA: GAF domain-containing sensor histidine kinase [Gaiellaceae bacterium]|nr:GAF domain-containing sensor histidine kinase [Gaiellaceae bacterium]
MTGSRLFAVVVPAALVAGTLAAISTATTDNTSQRLAWTVMIGLTGWSYVAAGLIARVRRPRNRTGLLLLAVGFSWWVTAGLTSSNDSVPWTVGVVLGAVPAAFLVHLVLAYPSGLLHSTWERALVVTGYALSLLANVPSVLFEQAPIAGCESCPENAFLVAQSDTAAGISNGVVRTLGVAFLLAVAVTLADRWRSSSPAARRALTPVLVAGVAMFSLLAVSVATDPLSHTVSAAAEWGARLVVAILPFVFLWGLLQSRLARAEIGRALAEEPDSGVQDRIRRLLHDPSAEVLYRTGGPEGGCIDLHGRPRQLRAERGRAITPIERDGRPLAAIVHDEALLHEPELLEQVAAAVGLEVERDNNFWALQASERRSRAILEALPDKIFRVSESGILLDLQENRKFHPASMRVGDSLYDAPVARVFVERLMAAGRRALESGVMQTAEWDADVEGDTRHVEGRFIPSGKDEFFVLLRDVTKRKRQEIERAALHRVALAVASEAGAEQIFNLVAEEVGGVLGSDAVSLLRYQPGGDEAYIVGRWFRRRAEVLLSPLGEPIPLMGAPVRHVFETGRPIRVDLAESATPDAFRARLEQHKVNSFVAAPIKVSGSLWGVVGASLASPRSFPAGAEERLRAFTQLVSLALANEEARGQLAASRARLVSAADEERRRIERNLHDGAQQRLVSVRVSLRLANARLAADPDAAEALLDGANAELSVAIEELRELARGIHPAVLTERGLGPALASLAERAPLPVELEHLEDARLPRSVEAAAYFVVSEALANVAKYARASEVRVRVGLEDGQAVVEVADDGVGGADPQKGSGLRGLSDRVEALDGHLVIETEPGAGTTVRAEIPVGVAPLEETSLHAVHGAASVEASDA